MSNYCDRHFNRKKAVWSVGFIVVQFFKCNLQFNKRNKSARRRLPVNGWLTFVRIFLFLDKNNEALLCKRSRQLNIALRLMPKCTFRSVMKKNQRPFSRQKSGVLYEKLFAISTAISGRNFGNEREAKREQLGQSVAHYTSIPKSWALRGCVSTKKQSVYTLYYHFAKYH